MKINCIGCGHAFGLDDSYSDYEGLIRCSTCSILLDVKIDDGMIKGVRPGGAILGTTPHQPLSQSVEPAASYADDDVDGMPQAA